MAKIRTIKVEFWTSPQIVECEPLTRLFFIGLWNFCDDGGIHPYSVKRLKMEIFPADESILSSNIEQMLNELEQNRLIKFYTVAGEKFIKVTGWHHQKNYEQFFKYPNENGITPENKKYDRQPQKPKKKKKPESKTQPGKETNSPVTDSQQTVNDELTECQHDCHEQGNVNGNVNGNDNGNVSKAHSRTEILFIFKTTKFSTKINREYYDELKGNYPRVNILQEFGKMNQWYCDHPDILITCKNFRGHIRKWIGRSQEDPYAKCKNCGKEIQKPREYCYNCENKKNNNQPQIKQIGQILKVM